MVACLLFCLVKHYKLLYKLSRRRRRRKRINETFSALTLRPTQSHCAAGASANAILPPAQISILPPAWGRKYTGCIDQTRDTWVAKVLPGVSALDRVQLVDSYAHVSTVTTVEKQVLTVRVNKLLVPVFSSFRSVDYLNVLCTYFWSETVA